MPSKRVLQEAKKQAKAGKSPSTQAGVFVKEEMEHFKQKKHGIRSPRQAVAIGLSQARRAGVPLSPRPKSSTKTKGRTKK